MTTIYVPRLIESAEQAEALPVGTLAMAGHIPRIARKSRPVQWDSPGGSYGNRHMVGWTALVSIEAEEETRDHPGIMYPTLPPRYPQQSRLVTPWEDA